MNRRGFLSVLGAAPWLAAAVHCAAQDKVPRIGFLGRMAPNSEQKEGFQQGLRQLGYVEGTSILIEWRNTLGYEDELRPLAAELVQMAPDVIVTFSTPAARAALEATRTIPVVFAAVGDPLATGLVKSLAKPEGNGTGVSLLSSELGVKRLDLLRQLVPRARRVAYLTALANVSNAVAAKSVEAAAQTLGIKLDTYNARNSAEIQSALRAIPWKSTDGILIGGDPIFQVDGIMISKAVRAARMPAVFPWPNYHEYGVLMSYGPNLRNVAARAAYYVDKILRGAKPSDLPVEQITQMNLIIDMRVARELGINVPQELLFRADRVIR
jgi:putative tryptophan/tyrosine transport system substrate-binding protein